MEAADRKFEFCRPQELAQDMVFIDGISRSGKSLVAPILSSFDRCELWQMNYIYEYLCVMDFFRGISRDSASTLARLYADIDLYNLMIGRCTNFRPTDESSVSFNLLYEKYQDRLHRIEGDSIKEKIFKERPITPFVTHYIFGVADLLFDAFKHRLRLFIVTTRHPLWIIEAWFSLKWGRRIGTDERDYHVCQKFKGKVLPWFASGWEEEYLQLPPLDQAIRLINELTSAQKRQLERLTDEEKKKVIFIPLECFMTNPDKYFDIIFRKLETRKTSKTDEIFQKFQFPRTLEENYLIKQKQQMERLFSMHKLTEVSRELVEHMSYNYEKRFL